MGKPPQQAEQAEPEGAAFMTTVSEDRSVLSDTHVALKQEQQQAEEEDSFFINLPKTV